VVLLAATAAALLLLLEVALPTVGLAGTAGLALALLAAWGVERQDAEWWPLVGVVAAVVVWGVLVARHRSGPGAQAVAAVLFLGGALGFAVATDDTSAALTAFVGTAVLAAAYPRIAGAAARLVDAPPQVGTEALAGSPARVVEWHAGRGRVLVSGSWWNATGPTDLHEGDDVVVTSGSGLSLRVDHLGSQHG
jgi:membrane-bound ClpP family serine protease